MTAPALDTATGVRTDPFEREVVGRGLVCHFSFVSVG